MTILQLIADTSPVNPFQWWIDIADSVGVIAVMGILIWILLKERRDIFEDYKQEILYNKTRDKETLEVLRTLVNTVQTIHQTSQDKDGELLTELNELKSYLLKEIETLLKLEHLRGKDNDKPR